MKLLIYSFLMSALSISTGLAENTVLQYPKQMAERLPNWSLPQFRENQWQLATTEAQRITDQWRSQPLTVPWTQLTLKRFVKHKIQPSRGARALALIHVAMFDALNHPQSTHHDSHVSVSIAAATVLGYLFPDEEQAFLRIADRVIRQKTNSSDFTDSTQQSIQFGQMIAKHVIQHAQNDGAQIGWNGKRLQWYGEGRYYGPGSWEPTAPYFYYPPDEPFAPQWKPWVLKSPDQFRPNPPPVYASKTFIKALQEVIKVNKDLTPKEKQIANFWVDGHGSVTPAGHWNQIAIDHLQKHQLSDRQVAKIFMQLNVAMADSFIAAWDSKYHYWYIRPITAAEKILGLSFKPYVLTPPFPSYVSAHATTSGTASMILAHHFKTEANEIMAMGEEAAHSRLLGGIHFKFDNDEGLKLGRRIARWTLQQQTEGNENVQ